MNPFADSPEWKAAAAFRNGRMSAVAVTGEHEDAPAPAPAAPAPAHQWLTPKPENIPDALKSLRAGVWRGVPRSGSKKFDKPPSSPRTGHKIATNKPEQWSTFEEAQEAYERGGWDGIGVLMEGGNGLVGIDLDGLSSLLREHREITKRNGGAAFYKGRAGR
jgi:hypothetical protein